MRRPTRKPPSGTWRYVLASVLLATVVNVGASILARPEPEVVTVEPEQQEEPPRRPTISVDDLAAELAARIGATPEGREAIAEVLSDAAGGSADVAVPSTTRPPTPSPTPAPTSTTTTTTTQPPPPPTVPQAPPPRSPVDGFYEDLVPETLP